MTTNNNTIITDTFNALGEILVDSQLHLMHQGFQVQGHFDMWVKPPILGFMDNCPTNWVMAAPN